MNKYTNSLTMSRFLILVGVLSLSVHAFGQTSKKNLDREAIKAMVGCYNVEFKYTETFAPEVDYEKHYDYTSAAFEWAGIIEETEDKIVLQHLLIINDSTIIKHWRQDWIYEANGQYRYDKDNVWKYETIPPMASKGKWTQNVYQVDDSPRYSGTATWLHYDGKSLWDNVADSPLPRREHTKRSDYNVMKRGNRVHITPYGWLHEQDNDKVIRADGQEDVLLVQEKGYNTYEKRTESDCKPATEWWKENQDTWVNVRNKWSDVLAQKKDLKLKESVDGKTLYEYMFYTSYSGSQEETNKLIDLFIDKVKQ